MTVRDVYQSYEPDTAYSEFAIQREQRTGLNSGSTFDPSRGYSPTTRWLAKAFQYSDFISNTDDGGYMCQFALPRNTIVTRVMCRVDTLFAGTGTDDVDIGTGGTRGAAPGDSWGDGLDFQSTGLKYDPDADYNPGGSTGAQLYTTADTIDVYVSNAPTAGQAILFMEVVSYHEALNAEW